MGIDNDKYVPEDLVSKDPVDPSTLKIGDVVCYKRYEYKGSVWVRRTVKWTDCRDPKGFRKQVPEEDLWE